MNLKDYEMINATDEVICLTRPTEGEDLKYVTIAGKLDTIAEADPARVLNTLRAIGLLHREGSSDFGFSGPKLKPIGFTGPSSHSIVFEDTNVR
ncbi:MAG TPA: hypothetical protein PKD20_01850 [Candidatus Saccharibacteria bacterium]|jgi:hypothetical protein|nr:hypothetical protein [Candidatus Saccharibacteria bacterium]HMT55602.1 hypothetical protein [Candidatus Saccharibacteria bacterium]